MLVRTAPDPAATPLAPLPARHVLSAVAATALLLTLAGGAVSARPDPATAAASSTAPGAAGSLCGVGGDRP